MIHTRKRHKKYVVNQISPTWNLIFTLIILLLVFITLVPLTLVLCISLSSAKSIALQGYKFIPLEWSLDAYKAIAKMGTSVGRSYLNTIIYTTVNVAGGLFLKSMFAYVLARKDFRYRLPLSFFLFFTTLFSGGLVPTYILYTRVLHINNTIWVFILPGLLNAFDVIMLRTFCQTTIPEELFDSAKLDGANDFQIYARIVMPLFKAGLATVGLFNVVTKWNEWFTGIMYNEDASLQPIMTVLQKIQTTIDFLKVNTEFESTQEGMQFVASLPAESTRMALALIAVLPLLIMYPFFQKYFVQGLTVGSVKG